MDQRQRHVLGPLGALLVALGWATSAHAEGIARARVLLTSVEVSPGQYVPGNTSPDERTRKLAAEIDETVTEGLQDLGLLPIATPGVAGSEGALSATDPAAWVFSPRLSTESGGVQVRLLALSPGSRVELVREEAFSGPTLPTLDVRTVVMLRELWDAGRHAGPRGIPVATAPSGLETPDAPPSSGKPVLALNGAVLGGYFGFAIQQASGSSDSRLVYPLVALGTGLGLGASLLVADEWNISSGDAWYLAAGMWWPVASVVLLSQGYGAKEDNIPLYSLIGAAGGLTLATTAIATHPMNEGDAVIAHSGGAFGALLGGMTDAAIQGETGGSLKRGIGWGAGAGVLLGGAVATQVTISSSRALLVDLSASLGALAGAALASPLLLVDESDPLRTRLWLASAGAGTIAGGIIGWYGTAPPNYTGKPKASSLSILPYGGVTPSKQGSSVTLGVVGAF